MPRSVASEIERRFSRINANLLESTVTMTRGLFLFAAVGLAVFFSCADTFLLRCMAGLSYCPHIEARTTFDTNDTMKTITIPTPAELESLVANGTVRKARTGSRRGYTSRKGNGYVESYSGKFGTGFALITPRWDTTQYVHVTYYVFA